MNITISIQLLIGIIFFSIALTSTTFIIGISLFNKRNIENKPLMQQKKEIKVNYKTDMEFFDETVQFSIDKFFSTYDIDMNSYDKKSIIKDIRSLIMSHFSKEYLDILLKYYSVKGLKLYIDNIAGKAFDEYMMIKVNQERSIESYRQIEEHNNSMYL